MEAWRHEVVEETGRGRIRGDPCAGEGWDREGGRESACAAIHGTVVSHGRRAAGLVDRGRDHGLRSRENGSGRGREPSVNNHQSGPIESRCRHRPGARPSNLDHHRGKSLANLHLIAVTRPATCPRVDDPIIGSEAVIGDRSSPAERARRVLTMGRLTRWLAPQARVISPFSGASDFPPGRRACTPMTAPCQGLTHVAISR